MLEWSDKLMQAVTGHISGEAVPRGGGLRGGVLYTFYNYSQ